MALEATHGYKSWKDYFLGLQGLFYFVQGIAMGGLFFITQFLAFLGASPFERILFQAIVWLPWYLKFIFGIISDNIPIGKWGRRKPYIIFAGILGILGWLTLPLHTGITVLFFLSGILAALGLAISDSTLDALGVDITPPRRRGVMQGVAWGFRGLGAGIAGILVGFLADINQWFLIFGVPGVIFSIVAFTVVLFKENPLPEPFKRIPGATYRQVFGNRGVQLTILFQILSGMGIAILSVMQTFFYEDLAYTNFFIGLLFAGFGAGMLIGGVCFGTLGDRLKVQNVLILTTSLYMALILSVLVLPIWVFEVALPLFFAVGIINGGYEATQLRIGMENSPGILSGTVFNLYASMSNIGQIAIGALLIGLVASYTNFSIGWQLAWVFLLIALPIGLMVARQIEKSRE